MKAITGYLQAKTQSSQFAHKHASICMFMCEIIRQGFLAVTLEKTKVDGKKQMKIKYYIESSVCRGIFVGDELYIESDLKS